MAGRGIEEIINLILGAANKPLSAADAKAATAAAEKLAKPVSQAGLKAGSIINIPKIPATKVKSAILDPVGYSSVKLSRPIESYQPTTVGSNQPLNPEKIVSLTDMVDGYLIPAYWDRMLAGETLTGVGDVALQRGYELPGGIGFMRGPAAQADRAMTASAQSVITNYADLAEKAQKEGRKTYLVPLTMPPSALDFQGETSRVAADLLQQTEPKKSITKAFDAEMKNRVPAIPSLLSDELDAYLAQATPDERKAFIRFVGSEQASKMGIQTDVAGAARYAVTDPAQRTTMPAYGGYGIARLDAGKGAIISNPQVPHANFGTQMSGEYVGRLALPQHQGLLFQDAYSVLDQQLDKNGNPLTEANKSYAIGRQKPFQLVTQEMGSAYDLALRYARELGLVP